MLQILGSVLKHFPKLVWQLRSYRRRKKFINFNTPKDMFSKIAQMSVENANNPLWSKLADKWAVRDYIKKELGEEFLIPLLGCYNSVEEIDFEALPDSFVLKTNNGCSTNIIVPAKDKLNRDEAKKFLAKWQKFPYGEVTAQLHYSHIKPLIIAEKFMIQGGNNSSLIDYKFYCVNGDIEAIVLNLNRKANNHRPETIVRDVNWESIPEMTNQNVVCTREVECPECFDELKSIVRKLAAPFKFVRVDMYVIDNHIYFGEFTFTPYIDDHFSPKGLQYILNKLS